jgi:hypothetical protein
MIKNWQHLCIFGRLMSDNIVNDSEITIYHDTKHILVHRRADGCLIYVDKDTSTILLVQGEDGFPTYSSEWAEQYPTLPYQIA